MLGASWARQARSVAEAQRRAYDAGRVDLLVQYLVRDEPSLGAWQSGLETVSGRKKPAFVSFALPLVQVSRQGEATTLWGQVRLGAGARAFVLERRTDGGWVGVGSTGRTGAGGFFRRTVRAAAGVQLRLRDPATGTASPTLVVV